MLKIRRDAQSKQAKLLWNTRLLLNKANFSEGCALQNKGSRQVQEKRAKKATAVVLPMKVAFRSPLGRTPQLPPRGSLTKKELEIEASVPSILRILEI